MASAPPFRSPGLSLRELLADIKANPDGRGYKAGLESAGHSPRGLDEFQSRVSTAFDALWKSQAAQPGAQGVAGGAPQVPQGQVAGPTLIAGGSAGRGVVPTAPQSQPSFTIKATPKEPIRFIKDGKVHRLSERGVARLMGVSDSYKLPEDKALARTVLGNGVPPPLAQAVIEPLLRDIKKPTGVTLFSGGGLIEEGLKHRVNFVGGHEISPAIAKVARENGHKTNVVDVTKADFSQYRGTDWLHASPVCKNFSAAKSQKGEIPLDIRSAEAVVKAIDQVKPRVVTVENVPRYQGSEALKLILQKLKKEGYSVDSAVYDAADYGTPQHRKRLLVRAVKGQLLPDAPVKQPPVSWWSQVKDLEHPVDPKGLANWQKRRAPTLAGLLGQSP